MFYTSTLGIFLLLSPAVRCEIASYGNFSSIAYATPPRPSVVTTTTTSTRGLGECILAVLGPVPSATSDYPSSVGQPSTTNYTSDSLAKPSFPTPHRWFAADANKTSSTPTQSTICFANVPTLCYTDITYSAVSVEPTGTGSAYASKCYLAQSSYTSVSNSWGSVHSSISTQTNIIGGKTYKGVTYYQDASTLCDGHARVASSPAIALSSTTVTVTNPATTSLVDASVGWAFPVSTPSCSIASDDCDPLWTSYGSRLANWQAQKTGNSNYPQITESPIPPPCSNESMRSAASSANDVLTGCGPCTIYGQSVQLIYFPVPTTVSRDMCASTPSSPITWFDEDVVSVYDGSGPSQTVNPPLETAVVNGHTFTSGTAYISISSVWIGDRCNPSMGTPVTGAILAMPSESVLSLRYRQDHFQYFQERKTITGYPFNFADLNEPIPYSAYQGQAMCEYQDSWACQVMYDNNFNPQLAIPPGIRKLRPEWEQCQGWYGGLYDPPMALQPATALATHTLPSLGPQTAAEPSPTTRVAVATGAALYDTQDTESAVPFTTIAGVPIGNDPDNSDAMTLAGQTMRPGDPETEIGGKKISVATNGLVVDGTALGPAGVAHVEQSNTALMVPTPTAEPQAETQDTTSAAAPSKAVSHSSTATPEASTTQAAASTSLFINSAAPRAGASEMWFGVALTLSFCLLSCA